MIKIEVLDYKYDDFSNNQINFTLPTVNQGWDVDSSGSISIASATGTDYIYPVTGDLTEGLQYEVSITISNKGGSGDIGFSTNGSAGTPNGMPGNVRGATNGTYTGSFTAAGVQGLRIFGAAGTTGTVSAKCTQRGGVNWDESIVGSLDVGNSEDFPLAVNFSISEARDLSARTGTFTKTFNIPATKNNNKVLKSPYFEGSYIEGNTINAKKKARIIVDDAYYLTGLIQLTTIGTSSNPLYYSCVFYGNNVDWSQPLNDKLLMDLSVYGGASGSGWDTLNGKTANSGVDLQAYEPSIVETWEIDDATEKTNSSGTTSTNNSPIIYPMVGYGENNEGGSAATIQLLKNAYAISGSGTAAKVGYTGNWNSGDSYNTPIPSMDWRPAIFIYDIIKAIFKQEGYTIISNFIETIFFKKLLMLLPNFVHNNVAERIEDNSYDANWGNNNNWLGYYDFVGTHNGSTCMPQYQDSWPYKAVKWDSGASNFNMVFGNSAIYDNTNGEFTIQEFGFYDISQDNLGMWITTMCGGNSVLNNLEYAYITLQRKTAGQSYWANLQTETIISTSNPIETFGCPAPPFADKSHSQQAAIELENYYLNKGDKLRWIVKMRVSQWSTITVPCQTITFTVDLWGGSNPTNAYLSGGDNDRNGFVKIMHRGERVEYGQTFDLKNVIDNQSTQLGFLKGVIHAFNLQFTTDTVSKIVYIEPFNDFFKKENEAIDWTHKIDLSKAQEDKWVNTDLKREFIFKYKTDSKDEKVKHRGITYWDGILDEFPYREFLSDEFEVGQTVFENPFFAGSYNSGDGQTSGSGSAGVGGTPFRANLWGLCDSGAMPTSGSACRPDKGYDFVPRLLNYVKDNCGGGSWGGTYLARVQAWAFFGSNFQDPWITAGTDASSEYSVIARACSYDDHTSNSNPMQPLTYASKYQGSYDCATNTQYTQYPYRGLYQNYYQGMMEMNKKNPRIKTAYFNLKLSDMNLLDLRRLVYFDGYYYRINRIIDYKPASNETTQVELIKWDSKSLYPVNAYFNNN